MLNNMKEKFNSLRAILKKNPEVSPIWPKIIKWASFVFSILLIGLIIAQAIASINSLELEDQFGWLIEFNIVLVIFVLVDFLILWRVISIKGLKNERFVFWGLVGLLEINYVWQMSAVNYKEIYDFYIGINYLIIVLGFLPLNLVRNFLSNYYKANINIRKENTQELERKQKFSFKFPRINKIPVIKTLMKWTYKEGWKYSIGLIVVLTLFIFIRMPYMNYSFEGVPHSGKYATHLPQLINMYENNNPFLSQNPKYASILNNKLDIIFSNFGTFPFLEWGFLPFMPLTKFIPLELLIRSLLTVLGVILLFLIYLFFKKVLNKKVALIGILLLAFNQLFQLVTYLTVMDLPALIFMFIALNLYLSKNKNLSYVFCGLSILAKYSFALIICPFLILLILFKGKADLYNLIKLSLFSILPLFLFEVLIDPIPSKTLVEGSIRLLLMLLLIYAAYYFIKNNDYYFENTINKINNKVRYILIFLLPVTLIFLMEDKIIGFSNFLTNQYLIFNWEMYNKILQQIRILISDSIYYLFFVGVAIALFTRKNKKILLLFLLAGIFYLVIAPGGILPHIYYKHIFLILSVLSLCYVFNFVDNINTKKAIKILFFSIIIIQLIIPSYGDTKSILSKKRGGTYEMSNYIQNNLAKKDKIIIVGHEAHVFAIYNKTKTIYYTIRQREIILEEIQKNGFIETMRKYNVKYYMTVGYRDFKDILPWFDKKVDFYCNTKMGSIQSEIGQKKCISQYKLERLYHMHKPYQYFELEKNLGDFYLYRIKDI